VNNAVSEKKNAFGLNFNCKATHDVTVSLSPKEQRQQKPTTTLDSLQQMASSAAELLSTEALEK
jgi:hypothetical protein